ncbi:MAG: ATP-binding protein [Desulfocapsaceae bacterium]|nr:ATP-binding protein [Desulfocapsaceae bacterium]
MDDVPANSQARQKLSATDYAIITCNRQEMIASWDERAEEIFGWSTKEANGQKLFYLIFPPTSLNTTQLTLADILSTEKADPAQQFTLTKQVQHKNGTVFKAHLLIFNVHNSDSITILVRDLSRQQRILEKINISYEQQSILDDILKITLQPVPLAQLFERVLAYLFEIKSLRLLPYGAVFLAEHGSDTFTLKAKRGFAQSEEMPCTRKPLGMCKYGQAGRYGAFKLKNCTASQSTKHCGFVRTHGHYCSPLQKGERIVGILCLYTENDHVIPAHNEELIHSVCNILTNMVETREMDIQMVNIVHDLQLSIRNAKEERRFSESILQGLTHGLIVADLNGNILTFNEVAKEIMSTFTPTLTNKNLVDILGQESAAKLLTLNPLGDTNIEQELIITSPDDDDRIIGYSVVPRLDALGREVGRIIAINDISEIKYVRREMEKMNRLATVAEIASAVAHEVRNPLAGIKIMAQSIEGQSVSPEEQSECLTRIIRQVDRLNSLLTEFFSYARPAEPQVCPTPLAEIIADTQPLIANKMVKNHITFKNECTDDLPPIMADPNQVQQVLLNLFLNAMDATSNGGTITVKTAFLNGPTLARHRKKHPGLLPRSAYVSASVIDDGIGMTKEIAEKVFEPFYTNKSTGTGLGLSIVYRTLRENNAAITVNSAPNKGTIFTIYFSVEK